MDENTDQGSAGIERRLRAVEDELRALRSALRSPGRANTLQLQRWTLRGVVLIALIAAALAMGVGVRWGVQAQSDGGSPAPGVMNYQGQLTDAVGNPLNGNADITFRLYDVSEGGTPLWTEAHTGANAVLVSSGLFSTLLGSIEPIPPEIMGSSPLYLGITVGSDAEMIPRQPVSSVAYALVANDVADGAITAAKLATGAVTTDKLAPNAVTKVVYSTEWNTGNNEYTITSASWTPIGTLSGTFTTAGGDLLIMGGPTKMKSTLCNARYSVSLDGDSPPVMCTHNMPDFSACSGFRYVTGVSAGQHTIRAVANNNCGSAVFGTWSDNPIVVLELKR
jgi:hypothetical protein